MQESTLFLGVFFYNKKKPGFCMCGCILGMCISISTDYVDCMSTDLLAVHSSDSGHIKDIQWLHLGMIWRKLFVYKKYNCQWTSSV
jgi:hypothetical protein